MKIIVDIWGGERSCEHVARSFADGVTPGLVASLRTELEAGFLVNLRRCDQDGVPWGTDAAFDDRKPAKAN